MEFALVTNKIILLIFLILALVLITGIRLGYKYGGWNRNLPYIWTLIIHFQYVLNTPVFFYLEGKKTLIGTDISNYYGVGAFFNLLAVLSFVLGYWIMGFKVKDKWEQDPERTFQNPHKWISGLFYFFYALILINMAVGGIDVVNVFFGSEKVGLGARGESYFIQNFTDSLITLIILAYLFDFPKSKLLIWIFTAFFLFSLLGFRYRILLTLFGLLFVFIYKNKIKFKQAILGFALTLCFFYLLMFSTENRRSLIYRDYSSLVFNPGEFNYYNFFDQSRGALADMAVYKLYDNPNKSAEYDYGVSMFGYIFIRMIPRSIFENKDDYYPPPQIKTTISAYDAFWGKFTGEATLSVAGLYIAFGWLGIVLGYFLWGRILRKYSNRIIVKDKISLIKYVIIALVIFQFTTRGYFPQAVDHAVYMLIPVFIIEKFSKKKLASQPTGVKSP